jgi:hypothetical protein
MSYIISKTSPFVSTKLTEKGREKLAKGQLNFKYWAVGDSEINYGYEEIKDINQDDPSLNKKTVLSAPRDNHPNLKYFVSKTLDGVPHVPLTEADVKVTNILINNLANERGFFDAEGFTKATSPYIISTNTVVSDNFNGTNTINITNGTLTVGNYVLFKLTNDTLGTQPFNTNTTPTQHLWYKVQSVSGTTYTLDRKLPLLANTQTPIQYIQYAGGELYENGMANDNTTLYWDSNTLNFDSGTNIQVSDVPMLNMNNIWSSNIVGLNPETAEEFYKFGSNDMMGVRSPFLCYVDTISPSDLQLEDVCVDASGNVVGGVTDGDNKAISVIHYTNNSISNNYGEFFYINDTGKTLELDMPDLMYHRRAFAGGSGSGDTMGMKFISKGEVFYIKNSDIEYVELIEDPTMVNGEPKVVGKILPHHQTIIIDNEEIVAALSYKSGRNWTLPELSLTLSNPAAGASAGLLAQGETIYVTYVLEDNTGEVAYNLPCQRYAKIKNANVGTKDVSFIMNSVDELPYMRKREGAGYDGMGFSATNFKVLYQIVSGDDKPVSNAWKEHDFTDNGSTANGLTLTANATIDPSKLENQLPEANGFKITKTYRDSDPVYEINSKLGLPNNSEPEKLQFGDERFFYGNLRTFIGASVYRTVFDVKVNANEFTYTTNPTRSMSDSANPPEIRVSEVGIYDSNKDLVFIGKLSEPIKLINGNSVTIELSMDF